MSKKNFDNAKLRSTIAQQDIALVDRFANADSILLKEPVRIVEIIPASEPTSPKSSVIRDTFSMPLDDYALIEKLRIIANKEGRSSTSKSEVVRAGLQALDALGGERLVEALDRLEKLAPGRKR